MPTEWKVGDKGRVNQKKGKLGPTIWRITQLWPGGACMVQEDGTDYAEQRFDTSLLVKEEERR